MTYIGVDVTRLEKLMMDWHQASREARAGRPFDTAAVTAVLERFPHSSLGASAQWLQIQQGARQMDPIVRAHRAMRFASDRKSAEWFAPANIMAVESLVEAGRTDTARSVVRRLQKEWPGWTALPRLSRLVGLDSSVAPNPAESEAEWQRLDQLRRQLRWDDLHKGLQAFLARYPEAPRREEAIRELLRVSRHHKLEEKYEFEALEQFLATRNPMVGHDLHMMRLAFRYLEKGDQRAAQEWFEKLIRTWPDSIYTPGAAIELASLHLVRGDRVASLESLAKARRMTFDPYQLRETILLAEYVGATESFATLLDQQYHIIENPASTILQRTQAHSRVNVLHRLVPPNRDPARANVWKVRLFIFERLEQEWQDAQGNTQRVNNRVTPEILEDLKLTFAKYKKDVFRYSRGALRIESEIQVLPESGRVHTVDWNPNDPIRFWNAHNHPLERMDPRTSGPIQSDFWMFYAEGLPAWAPAGAGGPDPNTGKGDASYFYTPGWRDWLRYVYLHEWLHHVDGAFWNNGWRPHWNLGHTHSSRGWGNTWPNQGDPEWLIGFMHMMSEHEEDANAFYDWMMSVLITPRMWSQAKVDGIRGDRGAELAQILGPTHSPTQRR